MTKQLEVCRSTMPGLDKETTSSPMSVEYSCVCGVCLATETSSVDGCEDLCLGCVLLSKQSQSLTVTRRAIVDQLHNLPKQFIFLSSRGWHIERAYEDNLMLTDVVTSEVTIRIKAEYDKPRVGVWLRTGPNSGEAVGFIFISLNSSLHLLREAIRDQLGDITPTNTDHHDKVFLFMDSNGWPITTDQEVHFCVLDLLTQGSIHLCYKHRPTIPSFDVLLGHDHTDGFKTPLPAPVSSGPPVLSRESTNTTRSSVQSWPTKSEAALEEMLDAKQILISYVRAEASDHALKLKKELTNMGFSVFLDVHEIKSGIDWQDSLNFAVRHCDVFVPLVTPRYGETQWTNREVKLADVLCKLMLPVNFVEEWPPRVLAIQWATTQFIPWKPQKAVERLKKHSKLDKNVWELDYVRKAAIKIAERLETSYKDRPLVQPKLALQTLFSCPAPLPDEYSFLSRNRKGKCLVVISAHPQQIHFVEELKELFSDGDIEVWSSTELEHEDNRSDVQLFSQESLRERILSGESEGPPVIASQLSDTSMDSEFLHKNNRFQEKADEAGVILVVLSKEFALSKSCMQQIYYCEHRKKLIPIKYEDFGMPGWMSVLIGTGELEDRHSPNYKELLKMRVEDYLQGKTHQDKDVQREHTISHQANVLQAKLKRRSSEIIYTYISGGARFYNDTSKEICRHIGENLAELSDICLVTGGFPGVGDKVARTYLDARERLGKKQRNVLHILPKRDPKVFKNGMQREDKTFKEVSYGETIFSGESVRDRESTVSRVFDICVLIEGGPGAAHEAEQFEWNDRIVIPVKCTGGAAGGKFDVPDKIFEIPIGVCEKDWLILQDKCMASPSLIGQAVANVVASIGENILLSRSQQNSPLTSSGKTMKSLRLNIPRSTMGYSTALMSPVKIPKTSHGKTSRHSYSRELSLNSALPVGQRFSRQESILKRKNSLDLQRTDTLVYPWNEKKPTSTTRDDVKHLKYKLNDRIQWASESSDEIDIPVVQEEVATFTVTERESNVSQFPESASEEFSVHSDLSQCDEITIIGKGQVKTENINSRVCENAEVSVSLPMTEVEVQTTDLPCCSNGVESKAAGDSLVVNGGTECGGNGVTKETTTAHRDSEREDDDIEAPPSRKRTRQSLMKVKPQPGNRKDGMIMGDHRDNVVIVKSNRKLAL